jgi:RNA polymerase sigma-70 factor, ECF subfamily
MDETEFVALYQRIAQRLRAYLRRLTGDAALADDILQDACVRLLRAPRHGSSEGERVAFLYRVSTNLVYDHWRRKRREREGLHALSWGPAAPAPLTLGQDLSRVFDSLRPRDRALLWLTHVEGRSHGEVARMLGLKSVSVRVLLFRARAALAHRIKRAGLRPRGEP